jgi:hypothetical protein
MKNKHKAGILLALAGLLLLMSVVQAQTGNQPEPPASNTAAGYDLSWWTVDSGGHVEAGSPGFYSLSGSMGQPDAGLALTGRGYTLVGGFWSGAVAQYRIYLPLVLRNA